MVIQEDAKPLGSDVDGRQPDLMDDGDQAIAHEDDDNNESRGQSTTTGRQTEKLYTAEGILNPKLKRAEKKRRKKAKSSNEAMDEDYDFKVDYRRKSMESGSEDDEIIGEVPMSGVKFDE